MKTLKKKKKSLIIQTTVFLSPLGQDSAHLERSLVHSCDFNKVDALADSSGVNTQQFF